MRYLMLLSLALLMPMLSSCIVAKDQPPMFVFENPIQITLGTDPIYFGDYVKVVDIEDGYIPLSTDNINVSKVNFSQIGMYEVTITIEDSGGNRVSEVIPFEIVEYSTTFN